MSRRREPSIFRASVLARFATTALVWAVPALIALPFVVLLLLLSLWAADGALIEWMEKVRGGILTAIGPLLVLSGVAIGLFTASYAADFADGVMPAALALVVIALGGISTWSALRRIARELDG